VSDLSNARLVTVIVGLAALAVCTGVSNAGAQSPGLDLSVHDLFVRGNQLYEAGDFEEAATTYEETVARGVISSDLFYNLGNAYYKSGNLGRAVLSYERALRLAPRDEDARANLGLVQSMLRDRQFVEEPGLVKKTATWLYQRLNVRESLFVASLVYLAFVVVVVGFIFRDTRALSRLYGKISMLSPGRFLGLDKPQDFLLAMATLSLLLVVSGASAYGKYRAVSSRRAAIVIEEEVPVYGGPSTDAVLQFKIHEGTRVTTGEARPGWIQVRLPGDLSGWVSDRLLERI
jgi:tetratricopeptide (TPR) repeat protein